jgi:aminoglycoside N3'-acetyltransferase
MTSAADFRRKAKRILHRWRTPIGRDEMRRALSLVIGSSEILFVHSSLSNCGRFTAGPGDVLAGLSEFCDTLILPTHTYCYPISLEQPGVLFDRDTTPSKTGLLTEMFRKQPGSTRSIHATHSLAARGTLAEQICNVHYQRDSPCGAATPYSRLVEQRASVLLFGVTFHSYTLFHTAEDASGSAFAYEDGTLDLLRVVDEQGQPRECRSRRQTRTPRRFAEAGLMLEQAGLVRRIGLGRGHLLFVPDCSRVHDFLVERLRKCGDFLYQSCATPLP